METIRDRDLTGAHFERVSLRQASFEKVYLTEARMRAVDFSGADIRGGAFRGARMRGVELARRLTRTSPGWPQESGVLLADCLRVVLDEEWEHRRYAERDLDVVEKET